MHIHSLIPDPQWCAAHPIDSFQFKPQADWRRLHPLGVVAYAESVIDVFNCQFRHVPLAPGRVASLRADPDIGRCGREIETILAAFYTEEQHHLIVSRFVTEWSAIHRRKLLLFYANLSQIADLGTLSPDQLMLRLFRMVNLVNVVYQDCDFDDEELRELGAVVRSSLVFAHIRQIVDRLIGLPAGPVCPRPNRGWTDRDHEEKLLCDYHEVLHEMAGEPLGWDAILKHDVNEVIRADLIYYASMHPDIYLRIMGRAGQRHRTYEKALNAALFVMGYLAPWSQYGVWRSLMEGHTWPGTACDLPYPALALVHFIAAWQYNDAQGWDFLNAEEIVPIHLDWRTIPKDVAGREKAKALLLCSILTYFEGAASRPTRGALYCGGSKDVREVNCRDERELLPPPRKDEPEPPPPPPPPPGERRKPPMSIGDLATLHAQGMMIDDLTRNGGDYDPVLVADFAMHARSRSKLASHLVDVAASTPRRTALFEAMEEALAAPEVPAENRSALSAYIAERRGEENEFRAEDRIIWKAVANAQKYMANPVAVLARFDKVSEMEEEIINDPRLLCDKEFLSDAFKAFYCQAESMAKTDEQLEAEGPFGPTLPSIYDVQGALDMGPDMERLYRSLGLRVDVGAPVVGEALVGRLVDRTGRVVGYRTASGAHISMRALVDEVRRGIRKDLEVFRAGDGEFVRQPGNVSEQDNLGSLPAIEVDPRKLK